MWNRSRAKSWRSGRFDGAAPDQGVDMSGIVAQKATQHQPAVLAHAIWRAGCGMHGLAVPVIRARRHAHAAARGMGYLGESAACKKVRMGDDLLRLEHGGGGNARGVERLQRILHRLEALKPRPDEIAQLGPVLTPRHWRGEARILSELGALH